MSETGIRILGLDTATEASASDYMLIDSENNGSKKLKVEDIKLSDLTDDASHRTVSDTEKTTWSGKQDALTFDDVPTDNSNNPVKSNGIYDAIASEASARSDADSTLQTNINNLSNETIHIDSDGKFFVYVNEE